ncbi:hypothetical protein PHMEG_0006692 [Phytophthora megakarya]|uniref:Uncharacterized protein n=1 Tax=Phytophthora megakarya TaxID=4795 RepID=A0A225WP76_9STRA|nr:hypothetical protein PHMEG_0006692 [Phytophthora megakarya]
MLGNASTGAISSGGRAVARAWLAGAGVLVSIDEFDYEEEAGGDSGMGESEHAGTAGDEESERAGTAVDEKSGDEDRQLGELQVKNDYYKRNHQISSSAFGTRAKRSKIYDYVLEYDQNVIPTDVDNLQFKYEVFEKDNPTGNADDDAEFEQLMEVAQHPPPPSDYLQAKVKREFAINSSDSDVAVQVGEKTSTLAEQYEGSTGYAKIELFARVQNLKEVVQLGLAMHKWLTCEHIPALPAECHDMANMVAAEVLETYPYTQIQGIPSMKDFVHSMLYRATPPTWLTDASIRTLCLRLADDFSASRFAGFQSAAASKKRTRKSDGGY